LERLRHRREFRAAATGLRASASAFVVQARRRDDEGPPRVGFTVSKQVGNAVERNRVRRRLREIVRLSSAAAAEAERSSALHCGHDYVLVGKRGALTASFADLQQEFAAALTRIHQSRRAGTGGSHRRALHEAGSPPPPDGRGARPEPPQNSLKD
jgi:ribonuclease P protein component